MMAGWNGAFAIEHDSNAFQTLSHNLIRRENRYSYDWPLWLPKSPHSILDFVDQYAAELQQLAGKIDLMVGGPPCQGFSSAGRRDPDDPRNQLVGAYLKLVGVIKPKVVLIENVRGITVDFKDSSQPSGRKNYASWIQNELGQDYTVHSSMLDLSRFGIPQNRHRYFIIALRKGESFRSSRDPFDSLEQNRNAFLRKKGIPGVPVTAKGAISDLEVMRNGKSACLGFPGFEKTDYIGPLTAYQRLMNDGVGCAVSDTRLARHKPEIAQRFGQIIELCHQDGRLNTSLSTAMRASFGLNKRALRVLDPENASPTITSMPDDLLHYSEPRTLTVRENARLQSFPDWFEFQGKYTSGGDRRRKEVPRFTQVANAVPPLIAEAIGSVLLDEFLRDR